MSESEKDQNDQDVVVMHAAAAVKEALVDDLKVLMKEKKMTIHEMARRLKTSRTQIRRIFDPSELGTTIRTIACASVVLGGRLEVRVVEVSDKMWGKDVGEKNDSL